MNIRDYYVKKKEIEFLIAFNERIHCPHVAARLRRKLENLIKDYEMEEKHGQRNDN